MALTPQQLERFLALIDRRADGCWPWTGGRFKFGHGRFFIDRKGKKAHRLAYEHFVGPIPDGLVVRHECDNPPCCNPAHLVLGTHGQNAQDRVDRDRNTKGEDCHSARLTVAQVAEIRRRYRPRTRGAGPNVLAREFGVSSMMIKKIVTGRSWKHVRGGEDRPA